MRGVLVRFFLLVQMFTGILSARDMSSDVVLQGGMGLSVLTRAFFDNPEYVGQYTGNKKEIKDTPLSSEVFLSAINLFADRFANDQAYSNQKLWMGPIVRHDTQVSNYTDGSTIRYVQKISVAPQSIICLMGDLHGSVHSLLRNLWRLVALGYLGEDLKVTNKHFYMVFLGDYVDRGRWSAEVMTVLLKLKVQNWDNVHLVAGNHETGTMPYQHGFCTEVKTKFDNGDMLCKTMYKQVFMNLPVALFIDGGNDNFIQCCHGGIEPSYQPKSFLQDPLKRYQNVGSEEHCSGLFWSDFCAHEAGLLPSPRGGSAVKAGYAATRAYLKKNGLRFIMRAHQDMEFGLKVFTSSLTVPGDKGQSMESYGRYDLQAQDHEQTLTSYNKECMYHWAKVAADRYGRLMEGNHFRLSAFDDYPVFTFSTAVEARQFPYDCFGLVETSTHWDTWMLRVYELFLDKQGKAFRHKKYVYIDAPTMTNGHTTRVSGQKGVELPDPITIYWSDGKDQKFLDEGMKRILKK